MGQAVRPYDLATAAGDFPPWEGPPRRTILVCSHPRSGSTLLGEAITRAGGLGAPLEYFHRGYRPKLQDRLNATSLDDYVAAVRRCRTDPSGVFSVKLFWQDLEELAGERFASDQPPFGQLAAGDRAAYSWIIEIVRDLFPNPTFVHLARKDRVRQAVSALMAEQTGEWRSFQEGGRDGAGAPAYQFERLQRLIGFGDYCHRHWRALFDVLDVQPYALTYEALDADYAGTVGPLLQYLGAAAPPAAPRLRRQSDAASEALVLRFLKDEDRSRSRPTSAG